MNAIEDEGKRRELELKIETLEDKARVRIHDLEKLNSNMKEESLPRKRSRLVRMKIVHMQLDKGGKEQAEQENYEMPGTDANDKQQIKHVRIDRASRTIRSLVGGTGADTNSALSANSHSAATAD
mmetsp:Transcript_31925/g.48485  ORF Transcript_31925/g.48485 Transcript_31925/m.48485 type:complete len:125 (+) Transcript_31925:5629-6003(+)